MIFCLYRRILCRHPSIQSSLSLKNIHGLSPLRVAIEQGNSIPLSMILEAYENPLDAACQVLDDDTGWTPIHFAAALNKV
jgi:ankyrin repeat protein